MSTAPAGIQLTECPAIDGLRAAKNATGSDIVAKRFVKGTAASITLPSATTQPLLGVTYTDAPAGGYGTVATGGKVPLTAGTGGVTAGDRIMAEANTGKGITWTASTGVNAAVGGIAQTTAAADYDFELELSAPGVTAQG